MHGDDGGESLADEERGREGERVGEGGVPEDERGGEATTGESMELGNMSRNRMIREGLFGRRFCSVL